MNHEFLVGSSVKREISLVASWVEIYMNEIINKLKPRKGGEINRGPSIRQRPCPSQPEPALHATQGLSLIHYFEAQI